ncbi:RNA ligase [Pseudomonas phage vB_PseuGesM_254]|uniref:RNA ligase n=1 Tax=Pseudomonas phage vB_PseuGesM_254 TaxID=3092638 RepID=A0AAX4G7U5_9CAUD|nr:RNA ligase [Pseudomonas phage PseuGes_254]
MFQHLIDKGLVKGKSYDNGLTVYKYTREVFYKALWNEDPLLLEARGMVLDRDGKVVIWPFTKVFNNGENKTVCEGERLVDYVRKVNGFMAACRMYKGELLVSTTGTLDSDFAKMARSHIEKLNLKDLDPKLCLLFEIVDENDPHIVAEDVGAWLIGCRVIHEGHAMHGSMATEYQLDDIAEEIGAPRPETGQDYFSEVLKMLKECKHEGFMVRDAWTNETIMKLKSPHYLTKKFIMRMGQGKAKAMFDSPEKFKESIDEEFYGVVDYITSTISAEGWISKSDQERRVIIEDYFYV